MGKQNMYYLMARDRKNDDLSVVKINERRGTTLEDIDLFTTSFKDSSELEEKLRELGLVTGHDYDFFIASQSKLRGETKLKKYELLYSNNDFIKDIAKNSKANKITKSEEKTDRILDHFAYLLQAKPALYELVVSGKTNIYDKYVKYLAFSRYDPASTIKYKDGGWARASYPLIRNILDATSNIVRKYSLSSDKFHRSLLDQSIIRITDSNYDENQLSFFDMLDTEQDYNKLISKSINTFEKLPQDIFVKTNEGIHINSTMFLENDVEDVVLLDKYLPQELMLRIDMLLKHRDYLDNSSYPFGNTYISSVESDLEGIAKYLKDNKGQISRVLEWCKTYESMKEKVLGDVDERGYQKRKKQ